mgnify:FL=1
MAGTWPSIDFCVCHHLYRFREIHRLKEQGGIASTFILLVF